MAARYVNPQNVVAQGLDFYTGLRPGSYDSGGGGGGMRNVYGAGSGGSAGIAADRTASNAHSIAGYKPRFSFDFGNWRGSTEKGESTRNGTRDPNAWQKEAGLSYKEDSGSQMGTPYGPTSGGVPTMGKASGPTKADDPYSKLFQTQGLTPDPSSHAYTGGALSRQGEKLQAVKDSRNARRREQAAARREAKATEIAKTGPAQTFELSAPSGFRPGIDKVKTLTGSDSITSKGPYGGATKSAGAIYPSSATRSKSRPTQQQLF